ncbi:MAG TPA: DUF262 domain-containing protein [Bacteroidia bacterium]|nr:DUF262 domain-containing protein [Bacteroidia bacterium]
MKTGRYSILDILDFQNLEQFVIPEIQRDYVWSKSDVNDVLESIKDGFENEDIPYLGFIYAYNDKDYVYKYFLIDGQQRITTIFLLLVALYYKLEKEFPEHLIKNEKLKLDYKVRQATHDFLTDFINFLNSNKDLTLDSNIISEQTWYHTNYKNDITIFNIINNFIEIYDWLTNLGDDKLTDFLSFVEDDIQLSYFDIENGRQGEDLYIYMNSRGRNLVENETLKAKFLSKLHTTEDKENWGRKWEIWQDFFWVNRLNNPDSDNGFNEFLRMVQIITMSKGKYSSIQVNQFVTSNDSINFQILPKLNEIEKYFDAYKYLVENENISEFYKKYEYNDYFIETKRKQIDYFRILPLITFISLISHNDEKNILRFNRFFYNISRKRNVGKDIRTQLITAIKLISDYTQGHKEIYDVCDLVNYSKGRTALLDEEEVIKLTLYKNPPAEINRENLELLFWEIEDHIIFDGEISFLLMEYFNEENTTLNYDEFKKSWLAFKGLFNKKDNYKYISKALVYYGNTWLRETPYYYNNYNCQNWNWLIGDDKGKYLMQLLQDMHEKEFDYIKTIIKNKIKNYFEINSYQNIENIKQSTGFFKQFRILVALDFYSNDEIWNYGSFVAEDNRYYWKEDAEFFTENKVIYNVSRYVRGGYDGRILSFMKNILTDENKLKEIINQISE